MNLRQVIDELIDERGIDRSTLDSIVCDGMLAAYQKKYPEVVFRINYDHLTGELIVEGEREVVSSVEDNLVQVSLKKARFLDKNINLGDKLYMVFEGTIGRVEILYARQIISQRIRTVEAAAIYNEFKDKCGEVVHGTVHKCERSGFVIKIDDALAFLPTSNAVPTDRCVVGMPIRALLKEVLPEPRHDNQLILDRSSADFLQKLLELEVPEVYERIVEIKRIVRIAGYKAKVAVVSRDKNIDPVGTCVGVGGSRIRPILADFGGEKIDVVQWSDATEEFVAVALKPARVNRVELQSDGSAHVWVDEDQRSYAIGRSGQNIVLASRLVGINIQLVQQTGDVDAAFDIAQQEGKD